MSAGFRDPIPNSMLWVRSLLLELSFCPHLPVSTKALVPGPEYLHWLSQAKHVILGGCSDNLLKDLVIPEYYTHNYSLQ